MMMVLPFGGSLQVCGSPDPGMTLMNTSANVLPRMLRMHCAQSIITLRAHVAHDLRCSTKLQDCIKASVHDIHIELNTYLYCQ